MDELSERSRSAELLAYWSLLAIGLPEIVVYGRINGCHAVGVSAAGAHWERKRAELVAHRSLLLGWWPQGWDGRCFQVAYRRAPTLPTGLRFQIAYWGTLSGCRQERALRIVNRDVLPGCPLERTHQLGFGNFQLGAEAGHEQALQGCVALASAPRLPSSNPR